MPSTKLTKDLRERVCRDLLRHRFENEIFALIDEQAHFADQVWRDVYTKAERAQLETIPAGWLPSYPHVSVAFDNTSQYFQLQFSGTNGITNKLSVCIKKHPPAIFKPTPYCHSHTPVKRYETSHEFAKINFRLKKVRDDLLERISAVETQTMACLGSRTTARALIADWPEIEKFISPYIKTKPKALILPVVELNEALQLP